MNILHFFFTTLLTFIFAVYVTSNYQESTLYWIALLSAQFIIMLTLVTISKTFNAIINLLTNKKK